MTAGDDRDERSAVEILAARALLRERQPADADPRLAEWIVQQARATLTPGEARANERAARQFAMRTRQRLMARATSEALQVHPLRVRNATVVARTIDAIRHAARERCAPWVEESRVAAGAGRALWDEECDRWIELPPVVHSTKVIALSVSGDSMLPVLRPGDVLVVELARRAEVGSVVVARVPDGGYVVKRLASFTRDTVELESLNPAYAPFHIPRDARLIAGVVTAVLRAKE